MASYEEVKALSLDDTMSAHEDVLGGIRAMFTDTGAQEAWRMPLVADHDPTLRFTNSTTSVMKPWLRGEYEIPDGGVFLTQPAMGTQGLRYWTESRELGPYASYFTSIGILYAPNLGGLALDTMVEIARNRLGLDADTLVFEVHEKDVVLTSLLSKIGLKVEVSGDDGDSLGRYRHSYGMEGVGGRNANLHARTPRHESIELGNLTIIESKGSDGMDPLAWEVSFDSTPVLAAKTGTAHAIATLPAAAILSEGKSMSTEQLVAADCAAVVTALALEGLEPRSKGKAGMMRKFLREFICLQIRSGKSVAEVTDKLMQVAHAEMDTRAHLSPEENSSADINNAQNIIHTWIDRLWET